MDKIVIPQKSKEAEDKETKERQDKFGWLDAGVHLAKVTEVKTTRKDDGSERKTQAGDGGIDIVFITKEGKTYTETFWQGESSMWRMYKFLKDAKVDYHTKSATPKDIIGKKVWLVLYKEVQTVNGKVETKVGANSQTYEVGYTKFLETKPVENATNPPVYAPEKLRVLKEKVGTTKASAAPKPQTTKTTGSKEDFPPNEHMAPDPEEELGNTGDEAW